MKIGCWKARLVLIGNCCVVSGGSSVTRPREGMVARLWPEVGYHDESFEVVTFQLQPVESFVLGATKITTKYR